MIRAGSTNRAHSGQDDGQTGPVALLWWSLQDSRRREVHRPCRAWDTRTGRAEQIWSERGQPNIVQRDRLPELGRPGALRGRLFLRSESHLITLDLLPKTPDALRLLSLDNVSLTARNPHSSARTPHPTDSDPTARSHPAPAVARPRGATRSSLTPPLDRPEFWKRAGTP